MLSPFTGGEAAWDQFLILLVLALFLHTSMGIPSGAWLLHHGAPPTPVLFVFPCWHFLPFLKYTHRGGLRCVLQWVCYGADCVWPMTSSYSKVPGGFSVPLSSLQQWSFLKPLSSPFTTQAKKNQAKKKKKGLILTIG